MSCDLIHGYDVRLYQPESSHQNVTRRVGSNQTFYIIKDEDKLGRTTEETYLQVYNNYCIALYLSHNDTMSIFQVRVVHRGIVSEWTHEVSLGKKIYSFFIKANLWQCMCRLLYSVIFLIGCDKPEKPSKFVH